MRTFTTWIANSKDNAALNAALAVARGEPNAPNPLVLIGKVGSGKTHLLHAIANEMRGRTILHSSTAAFVDKLVRSRFQHSFESLDAILLDDVHLFIDREYTFQTILRTLSECAAAGTHVVVTSDVRLRGMTATQVEIKRPDAAARAKILQATAEQRGFPISDNDARALARRMHGNVRQLHAVVWRLIAERELGQNDLDVQEITRLTAVIEGPEAARERRFYELAMRLRGKLQLDVNLDETRGR